MKKYLALSVAFLLALSVGAGLASAQGQGPGIINVPGDYSTIQGAIDAATDGDTIVVDEGTYEEYLVIDGVDVRLVAKGDVTLTPPDPEDSVSTYTNTILIKNSECTVEGFTIDVEDGWGGIRAVGGDPYWSDEGKVDVTVKNNKITDYERTGIFVNGELAYAKIVNNEIIGQGKQDPFWANNGIDLSLGASGIIRNNKISKNWYNSSSPYWWTSSSILLWGSNNVRVIKNTITEAQDGVPVVDGSNIKIMNNYIEGSQEGYGSWGIEFWGGKNNKVVGNTIVNHDLGIGIWSGSNAKVIHNTFRNCASNIKDEGKETKIHANK